MAEGQLWCEADLNNTGIASFGPEAFDRRYAPGYFQPRPVKLNVTVVWRLRRRVLGTDRLRC